MQTQQKKLFFYEHHFDLERMRLRVRQQLEGQNKLNLTYKYVMNEGKKEIHFSNGEIYQIEEDNGVEHIISEQGKQSLNTRLKTNQATLQDNQQIISNNEELVFTLFDDKNKLFFLGSHTEAQLKDQDKGASIKAVCEHIKKNGHLALTDNEIFSLKQGDNNYIIYMKIQRTITIADKPRTKIVSLKVPLEHYAPESQSFIEEESTLFNKACILKQVTEEIQLHTTTQKNEILPELKKVQSLIKYNTTEQVKINIGLRQDIEQNQEWTKQTINNIGQAFETNKSEVNKKIEEKYRECNTNITKIDSDIKERIFKIDQDVKTSIFKIESDVKESINKNDSNKEQFTQLMNEMNVRIQSEMGQLRSEIKKKQEFENIISEKEEQIKQLLSETSKIKSIEKELKNKQEAIEQQSQDIEKLQKENQKILTEFEDLKTTTNNQFNEDQQNILQQIKLLKEHPFSLKQNEPPNAHELQEKVQNQEIEIKSCHKEIEQLKSQIESLISQQGIQSQVDTKVLEQEKQIKQLQSETITIKSMQEELKTKSEATEQQRQDIKKLQDENNKILKELEELKTTNDKLKQDQKQSVQQTENYQGQEIKQPQSPVQNLVSPNQNPVQKDDVKKIYLNELVYSESGIFLSKPNESNIQEFDFMVVDNQKTMYAGILHNGDTNLANDTQSNIQIHFFSGQVMFGWQEPYYPFLPVPIQNGDKINFRVNREKQEFIASLNGQSSNPIQLKHNFNNSFTLMPQQGCQLQDIINYVLN